MTYLTLCLYDILVLLHLIILVRNVSELNYFSFILTTKTCWKCPSFPGSPASPFLSALQYKQWDALTKLLHAPPTPNIPIPSLPGSSCTACWMISKAPWQQPELVIGSLSCEAFPFQMSILHLTIALLQASKTPVKTIAASFQRAGFWGEARPNLQPCLSAYCTMHSPPRHSRSFLGGLACVCVCVCFTSNLASLSQPSSVQPHMLHLSAILNSRWIT